MHHTNDAKISATMKEEEGQQKQKKVEKKAGLNVANQQQQVTIKKMTK